MRPLVLHLVDSFHEGGSERQAVQLARSLRSSGRYAVQIASLSGEGPLRHLVDEELFDPAACYPLKTFYDGNALRQLTRFVHRLRRLRVEIVHTHDFYSNIFGMTAATIAGIPVKIASRRESSKRPSLKRLFERQAYRVADRVVGNCEEVRRQLIEEGVKPHKVLTFYNGLDFERVDFGPIDIGRVESPQPGGRREALFRFGLPQDCEGWVVAIVANLREVKDHRTFLRAAQKVYHEESKSAFVIAGEGPLLESLQAFARELGIARRTFFLGRCEQVAELLRASDVCVLSSRSEGFSNAILEYMAARRPIVATDVGGIREAMDDGEAGYLVRPGDDRGMAQSILSLLHDRQTARRMGDRGRAIVEERFSSHRQLARAERLYDELLAGRNTRRLAIEAEYNKAGTR
jgi:glycosyltransferase involved in cell wall biosynthesis